MTILTDTKTNKNFTKLESELISAIVNNLYAEEGFTDIDLHDMVEATGRNVRSLRGVLSSLIKKGVVSTYEHTVDTTFNKTETYKLILLNEDYYYLHPTWKVENI